MYPIGYEWLAETMLPRLVVSGLFFDQLPASTWLRDVCADAGKLFVCVPDEQVAGGRIVVSDLSLVDDPDPAVHVERARGDFSDGARRLKAGRAFDPARVGDAIDAGCLGDIALHGDDAGILIGADTLHAHVLMPARAVVKWPLAETAFRHPPATNGHFAMRPFVLLPDGQPVRAAMPDIFGGGDD